MGIRLFNLDFDKLGSSLCVITSITLVIFTFILVLKLGEIILHQIAPLF